MSEINNGGAAFPTAEQFDPRRNEFMTSASEGMSLRDYFAAKALLGLMGRSWPDFDGKDLALIDLWASSSYAIADAMLKARES